MATTSSSYSPPPPYYSLYKDYLEDPKSAPEPPSPIQGPYPLFAATYTTDVVLPRLEDQGVRLLYPKGPNIDYKKELRSLNQLHILELADVLVERPSQYARRVEEISLIFKNLHHLLNKLRPHQARATLTHILERQIQLENRQWRILKVCLDGSLPGYHLHRGFGYGANSLLVQLEGGGWSNDIRTCLYRKKSRRGSSYYMEKQLQFTGILSEKPKENPDFYNWNIIKVRYCDGASFLGEGYNMDTCLFFRGQHIWLASMEDLMSKTLLTVCSAGGLEAIHHCDGFRSIFPGSTKIKCLADAGMFLDAVDVAGRRTLRSFFSGVVNLQGLSRNLPRTCTSRLNPILCFFPQNVVFCSDTTFSSEFRI